MKVTIQNRLSTLVRALLTNQSILVEAAGKTEDKQIASLSYQLANDLSRFVSTLTSRDETIKPDRHQSPPSSVQHFAQRLGAALNHGDTYSVLGDLSRSVGELADQYRLTIGSAADTELQVELQRQLELVAAAADQLKTMRDGRESQSLTAIRMPSVYPAAHDSNGVIT